MILTKKQSKALSAYNKRIMDDRAKVIAEILHLDPTISYWKLVQIGDEKGNITLFDIRNEISNVQKMLKGLR